MRIGAVFAAAVLCLQATPSEAGETRVTVGGGSFNVPVQSMREARFSRIVLQRYDFSCGSAALATLLSYHYDRPVSEREVFFEMWKAGDQEAIRTKGFSLLDIKKYLASLGLPSDGFRVGLDKIAEVGVPIIALIDLNGYRHFVVVKGIRGNSVLVGDPAIGLKVWSIEEFEAMWNGIAFAIRSEGDLAKANFNRAEDWRVKEQAPVSSAAARDAVSAPLNLGLPIPVGEQF
ncbi:MAG: C39 family peptidase [Rhodovibrionaceae bacterium]